MRSLLFTLLLATFAPEIYSYGNLPEDKIKKHTLPANHLASPVHDNKIAPTHRLPKGQYLVMKSLVPPVAQVRGKPEASPNAKDVAFFELNFLRDNQAILSFKSRDPDLYLDDKAELLVHFPPQYPYKITPSFITQKTWPKKSNEIILQLSGGTPHGGAVRGKASFAVCSRKKRTCKYMLTKINHYLEIKSR